MNTRILVAIHKITMGAPGAALEFTGRYDDTGEPVMRRRMLSVPPQAFFQIDHVEAAKLVDLGAARLPETADLELIEKESLPVLGRALPA